jgi:hypothetical protein
VGVRRPLSSTTFKPFCRGWDLADSGNNSWRWLVLPANWLVWLALYQGVIGNHFQALGQLNLLMPAISMIWGAWIWIKTGLAFNSFCKYELAKTQLVEQLRKRIQSWFL